MNERRIRLEHGCEAIWATPEQVKEVEDWRGLSPFGYERRWQEIAFPEIAGLVREAIASQPNNPVDYICEAFELKRRAEKTLATFQTWVSDSQQETQNLADA